MRYHLRPVTMAIIKKSTNKCWRGCGEKGMLLQCCWECKLIQPLWQMVWRFLKKPPYDPGSPLLGIYTQKTRVEKDMYPTVYCSTVYNRQSVEATQRCSSTDEGMKKLWYIYSKEYYSAIKMNAFESVLMRWMNLEPIIQSDISQKEIKSYSNAYRRNLEKWS